MESVLSGTRRQAFPIGGSCREAYILTQCEESICYKPGTILAPTKKAVLFSFAEGKARTRSSIKIQLFSNEMDSQFSFTEIER